MTRQNRPDLAGTDGRRLHLDLVQRRRSTATVFAVGVPPAGDASTRPCRPPPHAGRGHASQATHAASSAGAATGLGTARPSTRCATTTRSRGRGSHEASVARGRASPRSADGCSGSFASRRFEEGRGSPCRAKSLAASRRTSGHGASSLGSATRISTQARSTCQASTPKRSSPRSMRARLPGFAAIEPSLSQQARPVGGARVRPPGGRPARSTDVRYAESFPQEEMWCRCEGDARIVGRGDVREPHPPRMNSPPPGSGGAGRAVSSTRFR